MGELAKVLFLEGEVEKQAERKSGRIKMMNNFFIKVYVCS